MLAVLVGDAAPPPAPIPTLFAVRLPSPLPLVCTYVVRRATNEMLLAFKVILSEPLNRPDCFTPTACSGEPQLEASWTGLPTGSTDVYDRRFMTIISRLP